MFFFRLALLEELELVNRPSHLPCSVLLSRVAEKLSLMALIFLILD